MGCSIKAGGVPCSTPGVQCCGAAIGQVWTRHCHSSHTCPTAFIAFSVPRVFLWPSAQFAVHWCPCPFLPGWSREYRLLDSRLYRLVTTTLGSESGSWHTFRVPCLVPLVRQPCTLALAYPGHTPYALCLPGQEGSRCEKISVSRFNCCHQPWQGYRSLVLKNPSGYRSVQCCGGGGKGVLHKGWWGTL